jgi:hypothetical protein
MAITAQLCRVSAEECRRRAERTIDAATRAAYRELVRAWRVLADTAEELTKLRRAERETTTAKAA